MEEINEVVALITPDIRFDRDLILAIIDLLNAYEELALVQEILKVPQNQRQPRSVWMRPYTGEEALLFLFNFFGMVKCTEGRTVSSGAE